MHRRAFLAGAGVSLLAAGRAEAIEVLKGYHARDVATPVRAISAEELELVGQVNSYRALADLKPLTPDPSLQRVTSVHAQDMSIRGFNSHVTPEGLDSITRINVISRSTGGLYGENVLGGVVNLRTRSIFETWRDSPLHSANFLGLNYDSCACSIHRANNGTFAVFIGGQTQVRFAQPLPFEIPDLADIDRYMGATTPRLISYGFTPWDSKQNTIDQIFDVGTPPAPMNAGGYQLRPLEAGGPLQYMILNGPIFIHEPQGLPMIGIANPFPPPP